MSDLKRKDGDAPKRNKVKIGEPEPYNCSRCGGTHRQQKYKDDSLGEYFVILDGWGLSYKITGPDGDEHGSGGMGACTYKDLIALLHSTVCEPFMPPGHTIGDDGVYRIERQDGN